MHLYSDGMSVSRADRTSLEVRNRINVLRMLERDHNVNMEKVSLKF